MQQCFFFFWKSHLPSAQSTDFTLQHLSLLLMSCLMKSLQSYSIETVDILTNMKYSGLGHGLCATGYWRLSNCKWAKTKMLLVCKLIVWITTSTVSHLSDNVNLVKGNHNEKSLFCFFCLFLLTHRWQINKTKLQNTPRQIYRSWKFYRPWLWIYFRMLVEQFATSEEIEDWLTGILLTQSSLWQPAIGCVYLQNESSEKSASFKINK